MDIGEMVAPRLVFGRTLVELGKKRKDLVVLDADVCASTQTALFRDEFPNRFYQCGIAEANMVGMSAGMAAVGLVPFVSTFAIFLTKRAGDQIRNSIAYPCMNVKLNGAYGGLPTGKAGATHSAIEDIAIMRSIPGMKILVPADPVETRAAVALAMDLDGPVYLRTVRCPVETIFSDDHQMVFGKAETIHEGKDAVIISTGMMTPKALQAAKNLKLKGTSLKVIHMGTIKPIDEKAIVEAAEKYGHIFTIENHSVIGGLGSEVSDVTARMSPCRVTKLGFQDIFLESGDNEALFSKYRMNVENIEGAVLENISPSRND